MGNFVYAAAVAVMGIVFHIICEIDQRRKKMNFNLVKLDILTGNETV